MASIYRKRDRILGIPYDNVTAEEALARTEEFVRDERSHIIVYLSLPVLMMARRNKFIRIFLEESDLIIPSGKYISWAASVLNRPFREIIEPSLFAKMLLVQSVDLNKSVYFLGGKGNTIDRAYYNLKKEIPRLFVIGRYRGNYQKIAHEDVISAIGKASPDYFFVGLGSPYEQKWVNTNREKINAGVIVLVENMFDLIAGNIMKFRRYRESKLKHREIPHSGYYKRVWMVPVFFVLVCLEKLFWRR
ncbi:MAG: WecB/TagA/CpsF family glycosyltransferase [Spirochaetota bacterium]